MNNEITPFNNEALFREKLANYLAAMVVNLKTYGKTYSIALLEGWMIVLKFRGITLEELGCGTQHFLTLDGEMPTAAAFANWCHNERERKATAILLEAATLREKEFNIEHRAKLTAQGLDPDELLPLGPIAREIANLTPLKAISQEGRKALPDSSGWSDPEKEERIRNAFKEKDNDGA